MKNPEQAEAELDKAIAEFHKAALDGITDFFNGRATLSVMPSFPMSGTLGSVPVAWSIRFIRDTTK